MSAVELSLMLVLDDFVEKLGLDEEVLDVELELELLVEKLDFSM